MTRELHITCGPWRKETEEFFSPSRTTLVPQWCPAACRPWSAWLCAACAGWCLVPCAQTPSMHGSLPPASSVVLVHCELLFMSKPFGVVGISAFEVTGTGNKVPDSKTNMLRSCCSLMSDVHTPAVASGSCFVPV